MSRIGYLGPKGTFSDYALGLVSEFKGRDITAVPYSSFFNLVEALNANECDQLLLPLENSIGGTIGAVLDLFTCFDNIFIDNQLHTYCEHFLKCRIDPRIDFYSQKHFAMIERQKRLKRATKRNEKHRETKQRLRVEKEINENGIGLVLPLIECR